MYTPEAFKFDNQKDIESFIQEYSFATVISSNNAQPLITHTPVVRLSDRKLYGHFFFGLQLRVRTEGHI